MSNKTTYHATILGSPGLLAPAISGDVVPAASQIVELVNVKADPNRSQVTLRVGKSEARMSAANAIGLIEVLQGATAHLGETAPFLMTHEGVFDASETK